MSRSISVVRGQCLKRRIGDQATLADEITAWERQRNTEGAKVKWMFSTERVRSKLASAYPINGKESESPCRGTSLG